MYKYIYGKDIESEEHMLYSSEIATVFKIYNGDTYNSERPYSLLITRIIKDYIKVNNLDTTNYYYSTRYGVKKVYPGRIYNNAINYMLENTITIDDITYYVSPIKKKYRYERR